MSQITNINTFARKSRTVKQEGRCLAFSYNTMFIICKGDRHTLKYKYLSRIPKFNPHSSVNNYLTYLLHYYWPTLLTTGSQLIHPSLRVEIYCYSLKTCLYIFKMRQLLSTLFVYYCWVSSLAWIILSRCG